MDFKVSYWSVKMVWHRLLSYASWSRQSRHKKLQAPSKLHMLSVSEVHSLGPQIVDAEQFARIMASTHSLSL